MIRLIEALRFRCLRYVRQPLDPFHVLVGPNASGKTTFLDVVAFLGQMVSEGPDAAIRERTQNLDDLLWNRQGDSFELAIEAAIPEDRRARLAPREFDTIRYEVLVGKEVQTGENGILYEKALLKSRANPEPTGKAGFPSLLAVPQTIMSGGDPGTQSVFSKLHGLLAHYHPEVTATSGTGEGLFPGIKLGPRKSAFASLPDDESLFPAATWLKDMLTGGVQRFVLNSLLIRKASPPGLRRAFEPDGSNLPWVVCELESAAHKGRLTAWISHLRTALPDIEGIRTVDRPDDKHKYLMIKYKGGLEVPSWMASDGTLRMLALTLPAYLPEFSGVYLIEEPENGVHPRAVETIFQSLSSVYDAQILLASHSPVILSSAKAKSVLCFKKTPEGATDIVRGSDHPALRDWQGETNLGTLFAAGVLG